jgi:spermidine synthase
VVGALYRALGAESAGFAFARFAILFVLLLPATALMGATLPVLVGHLGRGLVGGELAGLYAVNTFGAVAGSLAGGFALLPAIGLAGTVWVAAALNFAVAVIAWRVSARSASPVAAAMGAPPGAGAAPGAVAVSAARAPRPGIVRTPAGGPAPSPAPFPRVAFATLFALSGFAALVFQIAWVRLFALVFGSSVYSFSAVLGIYLLGLALGSAAVGRFMGGGVSVALFGRLQLALAIAAAFMLLAFSRLPEWMYALGERAGARWNVLLGGEAALCAALLLVPCALLGAAFPVAARLLQVRDGGHAAGFAYAVNTLGTIAGSLAAGFLAVPALGVQGTHLAALALSLAIGIACLALARARGEGARADSIFGLAGAATVVLLAAFAPRWDPLVMSAGVFRPIQASNVRMAAQVTRGPGGAVWRGTRGDSVLYYREGVNGSVLVGTDEEGTERWLRVSGKTDASTSDMETQVLLGLLPAACADSGARTLVIGLGSGFTLAGALAAGAGPTRVIELEPRVVEASRFFHAAGEQPLDDPRVTLALGDARTHLAHARERYDAIVSEPSNPWIVGVNNLFTVDFYRRVRASLAERGVFCQWMQLYELSPATLASMLASFLEVFPEGHAFSVAGALDVLLVALPADRGIALDRLRAPAAQRLLARAKIASPEALAGYYACPFSALRAVAAGAPLNRDDRPVVEYRAPRDLIEVGRAALHGLPAAVRLVPAQPPPAGSPFAAVWSPETWYGARARMLAALGEIGRARDVAGDAKAAGLGPLASALEREIATAERRRRVQDAIEQAGAYFTLGRREEGRAALEQAAQIDPANGRPWLMLADQRRLVGDLDGAAEALARGRADPSPGLAAEAALVAGMLDLARGNRDAALAEFRSAQRANPSTAQGYLFEADALRAAGDAAGATDALRRGLAALPGDRRLTAALAALGGAS